jgi:hypothetical protein
MSMGKYKLSKVATNEKKGDFATGELNRNIGLVTVSAVIQATG